MILLVCSCLNIRVHGRGSTFNLVDPKTLNLPENVLSDSFFESQMYPVNLDLAGVTLSRQPEMMTHRKGQSPDKITNLLREPSEIESDDGELSCSNLDFDEDIILSESNCKESEESAVEIDNIPVNPDIYVARDGKEWIPHNGNVPGRFATTHTSSGPTSSVKHNANISFLWYKRS
ncbi:uncharacterized protein TNCV_1147691 [Trichonephila clavipes]|nr:uncharacterized protein TNCV_1147691 [Trichonephila clavipes]